MTKKDPTFFDGALMFGLVVMIASVFILGPQVIKYSVSLVENIVWWLR